MIEFPKEPRQTSPGATGPVIKVLGIGGAGCNVVDRMAMEGPGDLDVQPLNTDARSLMHGVSQNRIQLGNQLTRGLGAGGDPDIGNAAARESADEIRAAIDQRKLVFLCAGLGGGTGSGATPEIARLARESGAVVVAFVTMPFSFEGKRRVAQAEEALDRLRAHADAVIVFNNDRMGELALATDGVQKAFEAADRLVGHSISAVARIISHPGLIRVGLDDLLTVLRPGHGHCLFGHGAAEGENRAKEALERALKSPLLNKGRMLDQAAAVLVHISGSEDLRLFEVQTLMRELERHIADGTQVFFGLGVDPAMKKSVAVTVFCPLAEQVPLAPVEPPAPEPAHDDPTPEPANTPRPAETFSLFDVVEHPAPPPAADPLPAPADVLPWESPAPAETDPIVGEIPLAPDPEPITDAPLVVDDIPWEPEPELEPEPERIPEPEPERIPEPEPIQELQPARITSSIPPVRTILPPPRAPRASQRDLEEIVVPADSAGQRELQLGARNDGGRFDKAEPTVVDGEDLDLPAYLRKRRKP